MNILEKWLRSILAEPAPEPSVKEMDREGSHLDYDRKVLVQKKLKALGLYPHELYRDFVPQLILAVEMFQASQGLEVDGIVGPKTWEALRKTKKLVAVEEKFPAYYLRAEKDLGLSEVVGPRHNPRIVAMFERAGHAWVKDDETAWCAAAVNCWLDEAGIVGTGKLNARSFLEWGKEWTGKVKPGLIAVFERGDSAWQGHVALTTGRTKPGYVEVLGGNQGNMVSKKWYPTSKLLGYRVPA